jgi:hypothetical protein
MRWTALVSLLLISAAAQAQPVTVPPEYRALVSQIDRTLRPLERQYQKAARSGRRPVYAAELLPANGNRGDQLLDLNSLQGTRVWLTRFAQLGIRGVVLAVPHPLLMRSYPGSSMYLSFYRNVINEARGRGMTVEIESSVVFANSPFSSVRWDYSKSSVEQLMRDRREMIGTIVRELAPDYLDIGAEPDTEARLTGKRELNDPARYAQYLAGILSGLDRRKTKIGAGVGAWSSPDFVSREVFLPLDFIALHLYPVSAQTFADAAEVCRIAKQAHKEVIIDEAWLYKAMPGEVTDIASNARVFARDVFSFWAPLDQRYLRLVSDFARAQHISFVSPFWSTYFFSYIDYDAGAAQLPYSDLMRDVNSGATRAVMDTRFTDTGVFYHDLIAGKR